MPSQPRAQACRRGMLALLLVPLYAVASHLAMVHAGTSVLTLAIVLGPWIVLAIAGLWSSGHRWSAACATVAAIVLLVPAIRGEGLDPRLFYLLQHAGAHLGLGLWFASTLLPGRQPLITALAQRLHGALDATHARYTRRVTQAWVAYFFAMAATSVALFVGGNFQQWSFFANLLTPVAAVLLFAGEYLLRYRLHPEFERVSLADGIRAYRAHRHSDAPGRVG